MEGTKKTGDMKRGRNIRGKGQERKEQGKGNGKEQGKEKGRERHR